MRICNICGKEGRDGQEFYLGVSSRCKECHKARVRENRKERFDQYQAYEAKRYKENPERKKMIERYAKTDRGKEALQRGRKAWHDRNPEKRAAHIILGNALRSGRITKPKECSSCGKSGVRIEGHHHDYGHPLDVKWLCTKCHVDIHKDEN